jgi:NitT/TauT family transport system ATP-binding protein
MAHDCHISAEHLAVTFPGGHVTLDDICLQCPHGGFVSLVGPSGCGKSTLLRCLAGLQEPTAGRLTFRTPDRRPPRRAYVFQEANLLPWRSVLQNVALPLELSGQARLARRRAAVEALRVAGLAPADLSKRPGMLSGGMRMRASLARALVTEPDVMLLDEPFAALDDISRQQLNEELMRHWLQQHWSAVFVTHHVAEAVFLSQRVLIMSGRPGRLIAEIPIPFDYPRHLQLRATAEFARTTGLIANHLRTIAVSP